MIENYKKKYLKYKRKYFLLGGMYKKRGNLTINIIHRSIVDNTEVKYSEDKDYSKSDDDLVNLKKRLDAFIKEFENQSPTLIEFKLKYPYYEFTFKEFIYNLIPHIFIGLRYKCSVIYNELINSSLKSTNTDFKMIASEAKADSFQPIDCEYEWSFNQTDLNTVDFTANTNYAMELVKKRDNTLFKLDISSLNTINTSQINITDNKKLVIDRYLN
jgi:hypothetical protein